MADLTAIRAAIAAQIGANTVPALAASAQMLDTLNALPMFLMLPTRPAARAPARHNTISDSALKVLGR